MNDVPHPWTDRQSLTLHCYSTTRRIPKRNIRLLRHLGQMVPTPPFSSPPLVLLQWGNDLENRPRGCSILCHMPTIGVRTQIPTAVRFRSVFSSLTQIQNYRLHRHQQKLAKKCKVSSTNLLPPSARGHTKARFDSACTAFKWDRGQCPGEG